MPKAPKHTSTTTPTASSTDASLLTAAALLDLPVEQRVALYVTTENRQRIGFLLQGKILHTLGTEALDLLRAAGIKPTSLRNARCAEWVFGTFTHPEATKAIKALRFHNGTEPVEFSEALYDTLTLRQCELLRIAFTNIGQQQHRMELVSQASTLLTQPDWEEDFESILDTGLTRTGLEAKRQADAAALQAERDRVANLERQIAEQQERDLIAAEAARNAPPPPPPVVVFNAPPEPIAVATTTDDTGAGEQEPDTAINGSDEAEDEDTPATNVVAFQAPAEPVTANDEDDTAAEDDAIKDESDDTSDVLTPEEIGTAVADATAGMHEFNNEGITEHIAFCLTDLEDGFTTNVSHLEVDELHHIAARLERLLDATRSAIAAKAAPQEDLPAAPVKSSRNRKAKLAA